MKRIVLVTGGFDPLHSGHISYLKEAKKLGDKLVVGLNSDAWLTRKKGMPFLNYNERRTIVEALEVVDDIVDFNDDDGTACDAIEQILRNTEDDVIFANGGDRNDTTTPEYQKYHNYTSVEFAFGVGGEEKKNSSSWVLDNWKTQKTERDWGNWRVLDDKGIIKTKELVIRPNKKLSNQKHFYRDEHWYILDGELMMKLEYPNGDKELIQMKKHDTIVIERGTWHQACGSDTDCHVLEVQYGEKCVEEDIERR